MKVKGTESWPNKEDTLALEVRSSATCANSLKINSLAKR
jgi:hypothetical protein